MTLLPDSSADRPNDSPPSRESDSDVTTEGCPVREDRTSLPCDARNGDSTDEEPTGGMHFNRRSLLVGTAVAVGAIAVPLVARRYMGRTPVFLAGGQRYDGPLAATIREGLLACGLTPQRVRGRRVLLKPNMVEPRRDAPQMTTNPAVVIATAQVFSEWGASVSVGEGPGHVRDTDMALVESGIGDALREVRIPFRDLNYEETCWIGNRGGISKLDGFSLPVSVLESDFVVSLPKLKTHHWVGFTAAMKNLYGALPGVKYGWPKNVLHHAGVPETVYDINATLPPAIAVVDAIECMEGDGPIMGKPKYLGVIAVGANAASVDATCARIMGIDPARVEYLAIADGRLGPTADFRIEQRGERWQDLATPFEMIDWPHLNRLRGS